jgi:hypothetical protein
VTNFGERVELGSSALYVGDDTDAVYTVARSA